MLGSDEDQTFFIMTNDDNDYPYNFVFVKCFDLLTDCQLIGSPGCCWYFVFGHLVMAEEAPPAKCIMAEEGPPAKRTRWKTSPRKFWTSKIGLGRMAKRFWRMKTLKFGYLLRTCTFGRQCLKMLGVNFALVSLLRLRLEQLWS